MKIKVLLVDDDQIEIRQFQANIHWKKLGFDIVGVAVNGFFGYQLYQEKKPDLIITDIEMPGMSGVELAEKIRAEDKAVRIIFLSSHEKFEYAHSGYQLSISDYILKQKMKSAETERKLVEIRKKIIEGYEQNKEEQEFFLQKYFDQRIGLTGLSKVFPDIEKKRFDAILIFHTNTLPLLLSHGVTGRRPASQTDMHMLGEKYTNMWMLPIFGGHLLLFESEGEKSGDIKKLDLYCIDFLEQMQLLAPPSLYIIKLSGNASLSNIQSNYYACEKRLLLRYFYESGTILDLSELQPATQKAAKLELDVLEQISKKQDFYLLEAYLNDVFASIMQYKKFQEFIDTMQSLLHFIQQSAGQLLDTEAYNEVVLIKEEDTNRITTAESAVVYIKQLYKQYYNFLRKKVQYQYSHDVEQCIRYVIQNYSDSSLDISQLAEHVALSPVRLRSIFKQETGKTIHQYITDVRMEKTKQKLLENKRKKLDSIAKEVGYLNGRYLSRVFKKECGITPEEFKQGSK